MSNQIQQQPQNDLRSILRSPGAKQQFEAALPKHLKPDRFVRVAITALSRVPKLQQCSQESLFKALLDLSALGLEPDGRRAHLIPFGKEVQLIIDYKGLVELVRRSGEVRVIHCDVVHENDIFDYGCNEKGPFLTHKPRLKDRGDVVGVYSLIVDKDGVPDHEFMTVDQVEKVRQGSRAGNSGPWKDHWEEMAKKTVFRRHSKWLPFSAELRERIEVDDEDLKPARASVVDSAASPVPFLPMPTQQDDEPEEPKAEQAKDEEPDAPSKKEAKVNKPAEKTAQDEDDNPDFI